MNEQERSDYIVHRLRNATETLQEARILASSKLLRGAVNRIYYSMFYAVSALALHHGFSTASHSQLRGYFNREFIKTGRISTELGKAYGAAFDSRSKGDYDDLVVFETEQVGQMLKEAEAFLDAIVSVIGESA